MRTDPVTGARMRKAVSLRRAFMPVLLSLVVIAPLVAGSAVDAHPVRSTLASSSVSVAPNIGASLAPNAGYSSAVLNGAGTVEVFMTGTDLSVYHNWCCFSGWVPLGGQFLPGQVVVATNLDGRMEAFAVGTDLQPYHSWQTCSTCGWSAWAPLGGRLLGLPAIGRNLDGRLEIFGRGTDFALYHASQVSPGSTTYTSWTWVSGNSTWHHDPVVSQNPDGRLEVFAVGDDGHLYHAWQTVANGWHPPMLPVTNGDWSNWTSLGGVTPGQPAVVRNQDGRLEVFMRGTNNQMYHAFQLSPGGDWGTWVSLGGSWHHDPVGQLNGAGQIEIFARGDTNYLYLAKQIPWNGTDYGGTWSGWSPISAGPITSDPIAGRMATGQVMVFFVDAGSRQLLHSEEGTNGPGTGYNQPRSLGGYWDGGASFYGQVVATKHFTFAPYSQAFPGCLPSILCQPASFTGTASATIDVYIVYSARDAGQPRFSYAPIDVIMTETAQALSAGLDFVSVGANGQMEANWENSNASSCVTNPTGWHPINFTGTVVSFGYSHTDGPGVYLPAGADLAFSITPTFSAFGNGEWMMGNINMTVQTFSLPFLGC